MKKESSIERSILGAGCFWGVEEIFRDVEGVVETEVGYSGGTTVNPSYEDVCAGKTNHAEVIQIDFDSSILSYEELLDYFFRLHDPTTLNRQHNDVGTQYRSVVFYFSEAQKQSALKKIEELTASGVWQNKIVTQVLPATIFYSAEKYHQDYLQKNPSGYMCHVLRQK